jgi:hypothetical protein
MDINLRSSTVVARRGVGEGGQQLEQPRILPTLHDLACCLGLVLACLLPQRGVVGNGSAAPISCPAGLVPLWWVLALRLQVVVLLPGMEISWGHIVFGFG